MTTKFKINWDWKREPEEYEEVCPECDGKGGPDMWYPTGGANLAICKVCKGRGKIDWIDKIKKGKFLKK